MDGFEATRRIREYERAAGCARPAWIIALTADTDEKVELFLSTLNSAAGGGCRALVLLLPLPLVASGHGARTGRKGLCSVPLAVVLLLLPPLLPAFASAHSTPEVVGGD